MTTDDLIRDLLATGAMNEDTTADLERMREEFRAGTLHADDAEYIAALHARVLGEGAVIAVDDAAPPASERIDGLDVAGWRDRALKAEEELAALRDQLASAGPS